MSHITLDDESKLSAEHIIARLDAILNDMDGIEAQIRGLGSGYGVDADLYSLAVKHLDAIVVRLQRVVEEYKPTHREEERVILTDSFINKRD
jgi:hypothetical protein